MNNLEKFRKKIKISSVIENRNISKILLWLKKRNLENKMEVQKIPVANLKDWFVKKNGNIFHKSSQFFSVEGVKIKSAVEREVKTWDQPILNQKHGGILAILARENQNGIVEFLLYARKEPGDKNLKFCPSFSATQSNINRAHGGKKTPLSDIILKATSKNIIGTTIHYEEGARFWQKPNKNVLIKVTSKDQKKIKDKNFIWLNLTQIKKLNQKKGIINPFVKTILFMI
jgi:dTDP-4-dehydro-6-deoxy-alpha-D-glucopyranose 2,3-dehydratase